MNIVIGFGSTEEAFERDEHAAIREHVETRYRKLGLDYFTDAFVDEVRGWLNRRADEYHAAAARYKNADDYPSRYSHYWPSIVADAAHIVVILSIHHVNRRHAMSPDGWALMRTKPLLLIESLDIRDRAEAA